MSKKKKLQKPLSYCSKCYHPCKLHCPVCRLSKIKRHCKTYDNPSSLHWHLRHDHAKFVNSDYNYDDLIQALNGVSKALRWGMLDAK